MNNSNSEEEVELEPQDAGVYNNVTHADANDDGFEFQDVPLNPQ